MNSLHLLNAICGDELLRLYSAGVWSCDQLPNKAQLSYPCFMISNTEPHTQPGLHWVLLFYRNDDDCLYFDSYGRQPGEQFDHYLSTSNVTSNERQTQAIGSVVCGAHCLFVACHLTRGEPFDSVLGRYSTDYQRNDEAVADFVMSTLIGGCLKESDVTCILQTNEMRIV
jgi:hypothetical protein